MGRNYIFMVVLIGVVCCLNLTCNEQTLKINLLLIQHTITNTPNGHVDDFIYFNSIYE